MRDAKRIVTAVVFGLVLSGLGLTRASAAGWSGPYAGLNLGVGFNSFNFDDNDYYTSYDRKAFDSNSFIPGLKAGYNHRIGSAVVGGELEYDRNYGSGFHRNIVFQNDVFSGSLTSLFALRGRAGVLAGDQGLVYVTAGAVYANTTQEYRDDQSRWFKWDGWRWGLVAGLGVEYALTDLVTINSELLHTYFVPTNTSGDGPTSPYQYGFSPSLTMVRVGANYRFGR
jgi:outer membrane immunogenic protein